MKKIKRLAVVGLALAIALCMAGCASMQIESLEADTVVGPKQVKQGGTINPRDITIWAIYKDGSRKMANVSANNIIFNSHAVGTQTVRVRVGGHEASFQTEVMALRSIAVASQPATAQFKQGQNANPSWPGLQIRGEWDQMGSDTVDLGQCQITGFNKDQAGRQTVTVTYEGKTATFSVNVVAMTGIQIAQAPNKVNYVQGDALDLTGLKVVSVWDGGLPTEEIAVTLADITGYNSNNSGTQRLTVTKGDYTAAFDINVAAVIFTTQGWNDALAAIRSGGAGTASAPKEYVINIGGNFQVPGLASSAATTGIGTNQYITVRLRGNGKISLSGNGSIFILGVNQTLIIEGEGITLEGRKVGGNGNADNNSAVITVNSGGRLELKSGTITGNTPGPNMGAGVNVAGGGTFLMTGGTISSMGSPNAGSAAVFLDNRTTKATFTKSGGTVYGSDGGVNANYNAAVTLSTGSQVKSRLQTHGPLDGTLSSDDEETGWSILAG